MVSNMFLCKPTHRNLKVLLYNPKKRC